MKSNTKSILTLVGIFSIVLVVSFSVYKFSTGTFFSIEEDYDEEEENSIEEEITEEQLTYKLSEQEVYDFERFFDNLFEQYIERQIIPERYKLELTGYFNNMPSPDGTEYTKEEKIKSLKFFVSSKSKEYFSPRILPILINVVYNHKELEDQDREFIILSGIHRYDIDTYIAQVDHLLNKSSNPKCNSPLQTLADKGVHFDDGVIDISKFQSSVQEIGEDTCLYQASRTLFGTSIKDSIQNYESFPVGNYIITYQPVEAQVHLPDNTVVTKTTTVLTIEDYEENINKLTDELNKIASEYGSIVASLVNKDKKTKRSISETLQMQWNRICNAFSLFTGNNTTGTQLQKLYNQFSNISGTLESYGIRKEVKNQISAISRDMLQDAIDIEQNRLPDLYKTLGYGIALIAATVVAAIYFGPSIIAFATTHWEVVGPCLDIYLQTLLVGGIILPVVHSLIHSYIHDEKFLDVLNQKFWPAFFYTATVAAPFMALIPLGSIFLLSRLEGAYVSQVMGGIFLGKMTYTTGQNAYKIYDAYQKGAEKELLYAQTGNIEYNTEATEYYQQAFDAGADCIADLVITYIGLRSIKSVTEKSSNNKTSAASKEQNTTASGGKLTPKTSANPGIKTASIPRGSRFFGTKALKKSSRVHPYGKRAPNYRHTKKHNSQIKASNKSKKASRARNNTYRGSKALKCL